VGFDRGIFRKASDQLPAQRRFSRAHLADNHIEPTAQPQGQLQLLQHPPMLPRLEKKGRIRRVGKRLLGEVDDGKVVHGRLLTSHPRSPAQTIRGQRVFSGSGSVSESVSISAVDCDPTVPNCRVKGQEEKMITMKSMKFMKKTTRVDGFRLPISGLD